MGSIVKPTDALVAGAELGPPRAPAGHETEAEILSGLIAEIYDTTLEPALWPSVLDRVRGFVGGGSAAIISKHISGSGQIYHHDGHVAPEFAALYFERYVKMDPANVGHLFAALDQPISTADIVDMDEFRQSRFHAEWARPQGYVDFIAAPLEKAGGWAALLGILRSERDGMVDDAARRRMRLIVPHVRRAVVIGKVVESGRVKAASLGEALDGLAASMFMVDVQGRVVHANAAGAAMLGGRDVIDARDGRIVSVDRVAAASLAEVIASADNGDAAVGVRGISVPMRSRDGVDYVAHVLPMTSGARREAGLSYAAAAMVFVQRAALDVASAPEVIARRFALTPAELRVLVASVEFGGVAETAEALGVGEATVKTHLHRLFAKTETRRQADLVKLVAAFSSPLAR